MTRFLLYLCHKLHIKTREKEILWCFLFPSVKPGVLLRIAVGFYSKPDSPGSAISLWSSLWFQHCHLFLFIMLFLSVGGGGVDTQACCTCTTEKTTNGCQEWVLLILLPRHSLSVTSEKRSQFFSRCVQEPQSSRVATVTWFTVS